jgi:hypothetical protein
VYLPDMKHKKETERKRQGDKRQSLEETGKGI